MKKLSTLYQKDPNDLGRVINEINPANQWVFDGEATPTRKFDGSAAAIINGELYKRYDAKKGKTAPEGAIPCDEPDAESGHHPHWLKCDRNNPADKFHFNAFDALETKTDGTYELCGEKVQGNPERLTGQHLIPHGIEALPVTDFSFDGLKAYLSNPDNNIEGIVFHHKTDGRMCKIRKSDFQVKR